MSLIALFKSLGFISHLFELFFCASLARSDMLISLVLCGLDRSRLRAMHVFDVAHATLCEDCA